MDMKSEDTEELAAEANDYNGAIEQTRNFVVMQLASDQTSQGHKSNALNIVSPANLSEQPKINDESI